MSHFEADRYDGTMDGTRDAAGAGCRPDLRGGSNRSVKVAPAWRILARRIKTIGDSNMSKALEGVRILDLTHVQSGPTCTQLLAWFGADVIKVERAGAGDITREQLRDIPDADSLYFTMLNHNKRSITIDTKNPDGKKVLESLVKTCDVLVENFAPGALDRMGFTWEHIQE